MSSFTVCSSQESNPKPISLVLARRTCAYRTFHWLLTALNEDAPAHSWSCPKPLSSLKPLLFQGKVLSLVVSVLGSPFVPDVCRAILKPPYYWRSPCVLSSTPLFWSPPWALPKPCASDEGHYGPSRNGSQKWVLSGNMKGFPCDVGKPFLLMAYFLLGPMALWRG